eukprot:2107094-Pleurochrysis_carterae.AAC.4
MRGFVTACLIGSIDAWSAPGRGRAGRRIRPAWLVATSPCAVCTYAQLPFSLVPRSLLLNTPTRCTWRRPASFARAGDLQGSHG